jgi:hypothetical protein
VVGETREQTVEFYTELYRAEVCDPMCAQVLFAGLPKLSLAQMDEMDIPLLSHELAEAVTQMSPGRAPVGLQDICQSPLLQTEVPFGLDST